MPSPWSAAGALAALYELGILQKVAPGLFTASRDTDTRTGIFAGLAGYGLGQASGSAEAAQLREALVREQTLRRNAELTAQAWAMAQRHAMQMQRLEQLMTQTKNLTTPPTQ